jgi:hypothetical protein
MTYKLLDMLGLMPCSTVQREGEPNNESLYFLLRRDSDYVSNIRLQQTAAKYSQGHGNLPVGIAYRHADAGISHVQGEHAHPSTIL